MLPGRCQVIGALVKPGEEEVDDVTVQSVGVSWVR
jgi:hypothetical protein